MNSALLAFIAAQLSSAPALVAPLPVPAPSSTPTTEKLICRISDTIGSRLQRKRICMTAAQWRTNARNEADDIDRRTRAPHREAAGG